MRLTNAPLVHVLADVQFSPVLTLQEQVPTFQAAVRSAGFPWYAEGVVHEVTQAPGVAAKIAMRPFWTFQTGDKREGLSLSERSLTLHTAAYSTVEPFLETFSRLLEALKKVADVDLVSRIGLRYVDRIHAESDDEDIRRYTHPGVLGFPFAAVSGGYHGLGFRTESAAQTDTGVLVVRSMVLPSGKVVPPDLESIPLAYVPRWGFSRPAVCLDFDHFRSFDQESFAFNPDAIISVMTELHRALRRAFDAVATEHAIERWGPWTQE